MHLDQIIMGIFMGICSAPFIFMMFMLYKDYKDGFDDKIFMIIIIGTLSLAIFILISSAVSLLISGGALA